MLVSIREDQIGPRSHVTQPSTGMNQILTELLERLFRFFRFVGKQGMAYLAELIEEAAFGLIV